ncbi:CPBP family intramembrane glutamic endopeptidase [Corynebacterium oculi]|uniref:CAAX amino terminal protease self-immunity n=1 Tax=Corynebacterium oculi TaxID=1544416 RepID=A0A0Q0TZ96_9CORY|nr:type II CAAX endopeptidase family protein [Corynebacterium oculi]KQB84592.1 CAAX amino terminal protease self- immunity [Corynebacterium oculi]
MKQIDRITTGDHPIRSRRWFLGRRPFLQLVIGLPLAMIAASVAGITQVLFAFAQGAADWDEALVKVWPGQPIGMALQIAAAIAVMWFVIAKIAGRPVFELSRQGAFKEGMIGAAIGTGIVTVTVGVLATFGGYIMTDVTLGRGILTGLLLGLGAAFGEEVAIRGILLRLLDARFGPVAAVTLTSLAFGALHLANPHATLLGALGFAMQAGVLFGLAYLLTRRLWFAIGMHAAINFTQAAIFGLPVSGTTVEPGLLVGELRGPAWLSGGATGIEGSVIMLIVAATVSALLSATVWARERTKRL